MSRASLVVVCALVGLGGGTAARAGSVTVTIEPGEGADFAASLGLDLAELELQIATELEDAFNVLRPVDYLRAVSDANAFSAKGLGADYASNIETFMIGIGGNVSVAFGDDTLSGEADRPVAGLAPQIAIMGGVNLGAFESIDKPEITVYANVFHRGAALDDLDASMTSVGVHGQYKFRRPRYTTSSLVLQWGGIDVTAGLEYQRLSLALQSGDVETDVPVGGDMAEATVLLRSTGRFDLASTALTLPLEVSTNWRLFYFVSLFVGAGVDLQLGSSDMNVNLDGVMTSTDPQTGEPVELGTVNIEVEESARPSTGKLRFLFGAQVNLWKLRVFVQGNARPQRAFGVAFGARLAF